MYVVIDLNNNLIMLNLIIILFLMVVNILNDLYMENNSLKSNLFLDISLLSGSYFLMKYNNDINYLFTFINILFFISLIRKRFITSLIICLVLLIKLPILFLGYILYYIIYFICKNKLNKFILYFIIVSVILIFLIYTLNNMCIIKAILMSLVFLMSLLLVIWVIEISKDIIRLHMNLKELASEEQFKTSLFKITHEIKNPIAVCKSYLDMFDINNKDHIKYIKILKEEMDRILILLKDFSCMSNIQIKSEIIDVTMLIDDVLAQYEMVLSSSKIKLIKNYNDDEVFIEGDYNRLSQVLINIIKNAKEAKDTNKQSFIELKTEEYGENFKIIITDNGVGISENELEKIKEPFYTTKKDGTGLGVSLSLEIIKAHKGNLEFYSKEGSYTKVIITLPRILEF